MIYLDRSDPTHTFAYNPLAGIDQTLLGLPRLLVDDTYRDWLMRRCSDPVVQSFWLTEYAQYDSRFRNEAIAPIQNKIGAFLANLIIRSILCQNFDAQNCRRDE